ncbi:MAG: hypothetical protein KAT43_02620 [Nanoarchaeota archaeon]|nr:hypothetical protein [Nanoarchaeota archaeon]
MALENLLGSVKNLLGSTVGKIGTTALLGAGLLFGGGCDEEETRIIDTSHQATEFTAIGGEREVDLSWDNPSFTDFANVMIRRKENLAPIDYTDGTMIYQGADESYVDTGLEPAILYCYKIFTRSFKEAGGSHGVSASAIAFDTTAPGAVSELIAQPGNMSVLLSWKNPSDFDLAGVKIVRRRNGYEGDTIVYDGLDESFVDPGVMDNANYIYKAFAYDSSQNMTVSQEVSATPFDATSPGFITNLVLTAGNNQVDISWENPTDPDFSGVVVLRKLDSFSVDPNDGTVIFDGYGNRETTSFTDTGLTEEIVHYYTIFAQDEIPNFSSGIGSSATPLDGIAPRDVSGFTGNINGNAIDFSWTNPSDSDFVGVVLRRKQSSFPTSPTDGTLVYEGSDQSATDSGLSDGDYFYAIFTKDEVPNHSSGDTLQKKMDYVYAIGWIGSGSNSWQTGSTPYSGADFKSFFAPSGVFVDQSGTIYVADKQNHRISTWSSVGIATGWFGGGTNNWKTGSAPSTYADDYQSFNNPTGVFVRGNDIYIADFYNHRVSKWFTTAGTHGWIGGASNGWKVTNGVFTGALDYQSFFAPSHVFVDSSGNMYIPHHHCISKWDSSGNAQGWIGHGFDGWQQSYVPSSGSSDYKSFSGCNGTFVDSNGNIYVADFANHRVSKWDSNGNSLGWIGGGSDGWKTTSGASSGTDYQSFNYPTGVFVDSNGSNIYVSERDNHRISKWDSNGNAVGWIGGASNNWQIGSAPSVQNSDYQSFGFPMGVHVDSSGNIYVADWFNNRISKWKD